MKIITENDIDNLRPFVESYIYVVQWDTGRGYTEYYKLHYAVRRYIFVALYDSRCWFNGDHPSREEAIKNALSRDTTIVYCFETYGEFIQFLYSKLSKEDRENFITPMKVHKERRLIL